MNGSRSELVDAVVAVIRSLADEGILPRDLALAPIGEASTLESLALDSMGRMGLLAAVDERLGIYLAEDRLSPNMKLGELAELLLTMQRQA